MSHNQVSLFDPRKKFIENLLSNFAVLEWIKMRRERGLCLGIASLCDPSKRRIGGLTKRGAKNLLSEASTVAFYAKRAGEVPILTEKIMRVLILTISAGQGHNQTSNALAEYLREHGHECQIVDAYRFCNRALSDTVEKGYATMTKYTPKMYGEMYRIMVSRKHLVGESTVKRISNNIIASKLIGYINRYAPDAIVCTHVLPARILTDLRYKLCPTKIVGIVTDFTLHPFWENTDIDCYVTPSALLNHQFAGRGVPENRLLDLGIPIHPRFAEKLDKKEARQMLGLDPDLPTVMVMMGSMGFGNVAKILRKVDSVEKDFQIISVCGKNKRAKARVDRMGKRHTVLNYGFTDQVSLLMDASDVIVTKPGGLSVSESLAKGLFMILDHPIPGQEDRNREFLLNNGLAAAVSPTYPVEEAVYQFLSSDVRLRQYRELASTFGRPNAARDVCELLERLIKEHDGS